MSRLARPCRRGLALAGLGVATLLAPAAAGAQGGADPRLAQRLDPRTRAAVELLVDSARQAGLPVEPLVDRALEGASKGAPDSLILRVVRTLAGELRAARVALGTRATAAEISAGADALHWGVRPEELTRLRRVRSGQPLTVALGVLADLVSSGVPADDASRALMRVAAAARDEQLRVLRQEVERDIALGAPPSVAMELRVNATARGLLESGELGQATGDRPPRRRP
jgi:hypothetical protein